MESKKEGCLDCLAKECRIEKLERQLEGYKQALDTIQFALEDARDIIKKQSNDDDMAELRIYPFERDNDD
jgi:hypothetical protein